MADRQGTLIHIGTGTSGRYPKGSGKDPEQRHKTFLGQTELLKKQGLSDAEIAKGLGMKTLELRAKRTIAIADERKKDYAQAMRLKEKGYSTMAIGRIMNRNESSVRSLLDPARKERADILNVTSSVLKEQVDKKGYIDVGIGVERHLGISRTKLQAAVAVLKEEGYTVHYVKVQQLGTNHETSIMVLAKPNVTYSEVMKNKDKIQMVMDQKFADGGRSVLGLEPVQNISSNRVKIQYAGEGGDQKDGVIELRRGVKDLSLGNSKYAQVRIAVDGTHFLKGMAMYADDLPPGMDVRYNTNKAPGTPKEKVFKEMKRNAKDEIDNDNPFGAVIKVGGQRGALNIINEEGDWGEWSSSISSQVLSKQTPALAKKQLELALQARKEEYDEIQSLTNPVVKKKLMESFAEGCDSAASHLKAAALPRQGTHVILPFTSMKENEIYAPNYQDGDRVVLIRHPHGGIFEIPELTVNNRNVEAKKAILNAEDGVGINAKVAERLSGADFDGDTVLVIPNPHGAILTAPALKGLKDFDPKLLYKLPDDAPQIKPKTKQMKMGDASNLITDMTIKGANDYEIAAAVRHSMVVIDAEKHHLDYKQSYRDHNIAALKERYQGSAKAGASTLISKASSEQRVYDRKEGVLIEDPITGRKKRLYVDPNTGKKLYTPTGASYTKTSVRKDGSVAEKIVYKKIKSNKMAEVDDAFKLSSGTKMETIYATHANSLKDMANDARKNAIAIKSPSYSPSAKATYAAEVSTLQAKLNVALKNSPLERQAQILANTIVATKKADNPSLDLDGIKKIKGQALAEARTRIGAKKTMVELTDREWEAIQAGAVSANTLSKILDNTDPKRIKQLATPRTAVTVSPAKLALAKTLLASGATQAEVAERIGISTKTLSKVM